MLGSKPLTEANIFILVLISFVFRIIIFLCILKVNNYFNNAKEFVQYVLLYYVSIHGSIFSISIFLYLAMGNAMTPIIIYFGCHYFAVI